MSVCVIPARGGSKRVPRKNIRAFAGRPMIAWSIAAARDTGLFERIIVSTDDEAIAAIARAEGAEVPFMRPPELSDDHTPTVPVVAHTARWLADRNETPAVLCCLYATAPLVRPTDIAAAHVRLTADGWDYVFPVARYADPPYRAFVRGEDGRLAMLFPQHELTRSQDLPPVFHDAGQFYWGRLEAWLQGRAIYSSSSSFIELPAERVIDIDTPEDWARAEAALRRLQADGPR